MCSSGRKPRRWRGSRGVAAVEAAIVTPVLFVLLLGTMEWGYAFLDRLTVKNASLSAARIASSEGYNSIADYNILQATKKAAAAMRAGDVQLVVVYRATTYLASVPASCKTASVTNLCNRYTGADFAQPLSKFGCGGGALDTAWCPTTRKYAVQGANGPPDYIGVYVQGLHHNVSGLLGPTQTFKSDAVMRIEPTRLA